MKEPKLKIADTRPQAAAKTNLPKIQELKHKKPFQIFFFYHTILHSHNGLKKDTPKTEIKICQSGIQVYANPDKFKTTLKNHPIEYSLTEERLLVFIKIYAVISKNSDFTSIYSAHNLHDTTRVEKNIPLM